MRWPSSHPVPPLPPPVAAGDVPLLVPGGAATREREDVDIPTLACTARKEGGVGRCEVVA